jgi:hypothetical protein
MCFFDREDERTSVALIMRDKERCRKREWREKNLQRRSQTKKLRLVGTASLVGSGDWEWVYKITTIYVAIEREHHWSLSFENEI